MACNELGDPAITQKIWQPITKIQNARSVRAEAKQNLVTPWTAIGIVVSLRMNFDDRVSDFGLLGFRSMGVVALGPLKSKAAFRKAKL